MKMKTGDDDFQGSRRIPEPGTSRSGICRATDSGEGFRSFRKAFLFFVSGFCLFVGTPTVSLAAHTLVRDGTIGAVMHVDPEDDPVAGQVSDFYFEFKDTADRLDPALCDGTFRLVSGGQEVLSQKLFPDLSAGLSSHHRAVIPARGLYQVILQGRARDGGSFGDFELLFDLRVERQAGASDSADWVADNLFLLIGGIVLVGLLVLVFALRPKSGRNRKAEAGSGKTPKAPPSDSEIV